MKPRRALNLFGLLVFACLGAGCEQRAVISGQVVDNFGAPVEGASVQADDAWFSTTTGPMGQYELRHSAGTFTMHFAKPGYADANIPLTLTAGTQRALDPVPLIALPPDGGLFLQGLQEYIPLARATVSGDIGGMIFLTQVDFGFAFGDDERSRIARLREELAMLPGDAVHIFDTTGIERVPLEADLENNSLGTVGRLSVILQLDMQSTLRFAEESVTEFPTGARRSIAVAPQALTPAQGYCFIAPGEDFLLVKAPAIGESDAYCF